MTQKQNIEQLFKSTFDGYEMSPSENLWPKTKRVLNQRQFLRFNPRRLNIYYTLGTLISGIIITTLLLTNNPQPIQNTQTNNTTQSPNELNQQYNTPDQPSAQPENQPNSTTANQTGNNNNEKTTAIGQSTFDNDTSDPLNDNITSNDNDHYITPDINPEPTFTLIPYFTPTIREGCAPLEVTFINSTSNAVSFSWNLGADHPLSKEQQPSKTYYEPGTYTVTLSATDKNGLSLSYSDQITVFPTPKAEFEISDEYIYNYSTNATTYSWSLVAGDTFYISSEYQFPLTEALNNQQPATSNQQPALLLISTNQFGCSDTAIHLIPLSSSPELTFPTAFSPNPDGSLGGFYNPNEPNNQVFYPKYKERPTTYNLKIFSKTGEIIFETDDIALGWDGYHKESPAPRGVYIYQCTGSWKSGEPFSYRGDITILWSDK